MGGKTVRMTKRYPQAEAQREAYNAYQRRYRAEHKDKARQWQTNYIIRKAARLAAEAAGQVEQAKAD